MVKLQKALKLSPDVIDDITTRTDKEEFNFSEWVELTYIKTFMSEEGIQKILNFHEKKAKKYRNMLEYSAKKRQKILNNVKKGLNSDEKKFTEKSRKILQNDTSKLEARLRLWNNTFKDNKMTKSQFVGLLGL